MCGRVCEGLLIWSLITPHYNVCSNKTLLLLLSPQGHTGLLFLTGSLFFTSWNSPGSPFLGVTDTDCLSFFTSPNAQYEQEIL